MLKWLGGLLDSNEREIKRLQPLVEKVNALEADFQRLSDAELRGKTDQFKARYQEKNRLDELLPEAFAAVREAAKRSIGLRHFDVQMIGGMVLHQGKIAEMKTGEGKTLVATLPLYLNALTGRGCHLVTVNDYLAKRDCQWMGPVYHGLGVSVAAIQHQDPSVTQPSSLVYDPEYASEDQRWPHLRPVTRRQAYQADITYGTNNEFGFDYLRDNMVVDLSQCVQRPLNYAIVDEVDYILIDEARTPLIISGAAEESAQKYAIFARLVPQLVKEADYTVDEKARSVVLTDDGMAKMERLLLKEGLLKAANLYDPSNYALTHYLESALKAYVLFRRDKDYVVNKDGVVIVDEFTGRLMPGRRYSEGLHQAIEAKERVKVQRESVTLATITFQNYFRLYSKLAGMTGTAATEAEEFSRIYKLEVVVIPTNKPTVREDHPDQIYKTEEAKFRAVCNDVEKLHAEKRPVLIGTTSIEASERLSEMLQRRGVPHQVLNAKHHEKEAYIIAQAGRPGAATVATNMAGRGVDIILGGNPEGRDSEEWLSDHKNVVALGGLHIIGTERHEARRIDNQLRGRSGRQGDPGSSRFYISLDDDVARRFGGDRIRGIMNWAGIEDDVPIPLSLVSKAIENAQVRVEGHHFEIRKHLVDYDDVVNKHREVIYQERKKILSDGDVKAHIQSMIRDELSAIVSARFDGEQPDVEGLLEDVTRIMPLPPELSRQTLSKLRPEEIEEKLAENARSMYEKKEEAVGDSNMRILERLVMLRVLDNLWTEHLTMMEHMRQGIGLQAVGHSDPLVAYKKEGHALFQSLLANIQHDLVHTIYHVDIVKKDAAKAEADRRNAVPVDKGTGRNDPCPCGSGKKYKKCCGK